MNQPKKIAHIEDQKSDMLESDFIKYLSENNISYEFLDELSGATKYLLENEIDLILLDLQLRVPQSVRERLKIPENAAEATGWWVLKTQLEQQKIKRKNIPIIIYTTNYYNQIESQLLYLKYEYNVDIRYIQKNEGGYKKKLKDEIAEIVLEK
jgi:CheY-like chemotaxis protein